MVIRTYSFLIFLALAAVLISDSCTSAPSLPPPTPSATPTTPTGVPYVDRVIQAVQSGDHQALQPLIVLSTVPCTDQKWLLRQPLCVEGETDGTLVQTLPILSSDLGHLRADHISTCLGICEAQLYAVYRTGSYTYTDELFPLGEYAVAFIPEASVPEGPVFATIFQVTRDGIVRIDHCAVSLDICSGSTIEEIFQEHPDAFLLGPLPLDQ